MVTAATSSGGAFDPASTDRSDARYAWDFCGGDLAIDFTNTVGSRGGTPAEHFRTAGDIVAWMEARGVLAPSAAARLRRELHAEPAAARRGFDRTIELREALYRTLAARAGGRTPRPDDLAIVNRALAATLSRTRLAVRGDRLDLIVDDDRGGLDAALHPIVRAAADLLTGDALSRVRLCGDPECAWLFVDTTRNGRRRWCDMNTCGNRAKVRRFRGRQD
jgi:predicted RNA-binding Zn ribbon-like protein